jgi:hypothetical protein
VADDVVLVPPGELAWTVAQHPFGRRVDERGSLVEVQPVDALAHGGQDRLVLADQTLQVLLVLLGLRYVLYLGHDVERPVLRIAHQGGTEKNPDRLSALVDVALLRVEVPYLPGKHPSQALDAFLEIVGVGDALEVRGEQLYL